MHRLLEQAPAPTLWTMNDTRQVSPAILRRMMFTLELRPPTSGVRGADLGTALERHGIARGRTRRCRWPGSSRPPPGWRPGPPPPPGSGAAESPRCATAYGASPGFSGATRRPGNAAPIRPCSHSGRYRSDRARGSSRSSGERPLLPLPAGGRRDGQERLRPLSCRAPRPGGHAEAGVRSVVVWVGGTERQIADAFAEARDTDSFLVSTKPIRCSPIAVRREDVGSGQVNEMLTLDGEPSPALCLYDQLRPAPRPRHPAALHRQGHARLSRAPRKPRLPSAPTSALTPPPQIRSSPP